MFTRLLIISQVFNASIPWQPIPVHTVPRDEDMVGLLYVYVYMTTGLSCMYKCMWSCHTCTVFVCGRIVMRYNVLSFFLHTYNDVHTHTQLLRAYAEDCPRYKLLREEDERLLT